MEAVPVNLAYLKIKRSKVKVTRPINAVTDNAPYAGRKIYNFLKMSCLAMKRPFGMEHL